MTSLLKVRKLMCEEGCQAWTPQVSDLSNTCILSTAESIFHISNYLGQGLKQKLCKAVFHKFTPKMFQSDVGSSNWDSEKFCNFPEVTKCSGLPQRVDISRLSTLNKGRIPLAFTIAATVYQDA